jgi:hypothetical protein
MVRMLGILRSTEAHIENMSLADKVSMENYAAGINKVAEHLIVYPPEF